MRPLSTVQTKNKDQTIETYQKRLCLIADLEKYRQLVFVYWKRRKELCRIPVANVTDNSS